MMGLDFDRIAAEHADPLDDSLQDFDRRRNYATYFIAFVVIAVLAGVIMLFVRAPKLDAADKQMIERAQLLEVAITEYYASHAEYPDSLALVADYFPTKQQWPSEPYNSKPMEETGSAEFTAPASVGMVHYEKIDQEGKTGYRLYVFGREDVLKVFWGGYAMEP